MSSKLRTTLGKSFCGTKVHLQPKLSGFSYIPNSLIRHLIIQQPRCNDTNFVTPNFLVKTYLYNTTAPFVNTTFLDPQNVI